VATNLRSLTYVPPKGGRHTGVAPGQQPDPAADYMKNFAKIIPAEAMAAYTALTGVAGTDPSAVLFAGVGCLIGTFAIRLLTGQEPGRAKLQWLPALGTALAFALYVYAQGGDLGFRFGYDVPASADASDPLKVRASILAGLWAFFAPVIVPRLAAFFR